MPVVRLKGLNRAKVRLKSGRTVVYWYAWKGGPRLEGEPGSPEFIDSFNKAVADRHAPDDATLAGLVAKYRAAPEFTKLANITQAGWRRVLDRIAADEGPDDIGGLTLTALDDRRCRADIMDWRNQWAANPRTADYAMQVLSRVLSWGVEYGHLAINAAAGVKQLYKSNRAEQIWLEEETAAFVSAAPSPEVGFIVPLATMTGLRRADLCRLSASHVGDIAIVMTTGKSQGAKTIVIPILPDLRDLLARIRAQQIKRHAELVENARRKKRPPPPLCLTVLSNTRGGPWTAHGLEGQVIKTKAKAGVDKHLHDARGTFGTRLRRAGLTAPEIADILGWEEDRVERLLATYVDRNSIVMALAKRINRNEADQAND